MKLNPEKGARRPLSYASAVDREPCEGWQASPSNPTKSKRKPHSKDRGERTSVVTFRCTALEKKLLISKAERAGLPFADLLREALGIVDSRRRKPVPRVDPELIRAVSRVGSNVNQIARWLNAMTAAGHVAEIEAFVVASRLVAVDRALNGLISTTASKPQIAKKREC